MTAFPGGEGSPGPAGPAGDRFWWIAEAGAAKGPYHEAYLVTATRMGVSNWPGPVNVRVKVRLFG